MAELETRLETASRTNLTLQSQAADTVRFTREYRGIRTPMNTQTVQLTREYGGIEPCMNPEGFLQSQAAETVRFTREYAGIRTPMNPEGFEHL